MPIITQQAELPKSKPTPSPDVRQPDNVEATSEATKAQEAPLSPKFAALARQQKAIRAQEQKLKAEKVAFEELRKQYESDYVPKSRLKSETLSVLAEQGISYDEITNAILNSGKPEDVAFKKLEAEIKALKESQLQSQTKQEEQVKQQYEQAVNQIRNQVKMLVDSDPAFETVKETDSAEAVVEYITHVFEHGDEENNRLPGTVLDVEVAAAEVESHLVENALKMAQLKKIKEKLAPPLAQAVAQKPLTTQKQPLQTLSNAVSASSTKSLTSKERRERAILAFRNQLK